MSDERSRRALELLRGAFERQDDDRACWLAEATSGDEALRAEVEALLDVSASADGFLETVVDQALGGLAVRDPWVGQRIGPYRVLRRIGDGGMSTVYLASREDDEFAQQVAIKVIKRGMDSEDVERRFRQERQILAHLDHPNIAKLLDGGTTENGQPFFILEYIDGLTIDRYCQTKALPVRDRIRLFLTVCAAVEHAHRSLVVHRDLKPSNILVTQSGVPKLLDFGIAKLLAGPMLDAPTARAQRPLTPGYASPEQIRGEPTTTSSDVYSLGVLLYRLLSDQPPYQLQDTTPSEVERQVLRAQIPPPSAAVSRAARAGDAHDARRAQTRVRQLRGDLDTITLEALRPEPGERYASVDHLASDLRRFLDERPVRARRPTASYRLGKLIRRHKPAAIATFLGLVALAGGIAATVWQARVALEERTRAEAERDRAEQVVRLLPELFEVVDPSSGRGNTVTAREWLDSAAAKIEWQLADRPLLQAELLDTIGPIYRKLGLFEQAASVLERALDLRRTALGPAHQSIAQSLDHLGALRVEQGEYAAAEPLLTEALAMRHAVLGETHPRVAESLNNLGELNHVRGDLDDAEARFTEALAKLPPSGSDPVLLAAVLNNLAAVRGARGDLGGSERLLEEALEVYRRGPGIRNPEYASTLNNLGLLHFQRGALDAAEPLLVAALELRRELLGDDHHEVAQSLNNLARVRYELGDAVGAEPLYQEAVARKRAQLGSHHPSLAFSLHGLARVLAAQERVSEAEVLYRQALAIRRDKLAAGSPVLAETLLRLGELLLDDRRPGEAEPLLDEAVRIRRAVLQGDDWRIAEAENALGGAYAVLGRLEDGSMLLDRSLSVLVRDLGDEHRATQKARERGRTASGSTDKRAERPDRRW